MNKELLFAADLERNTLSVLNKMLEGASKELHPVIHMLLYVQKGWNELLQLLEKEDYPEPNAAVLAGSEKEWLQVMASLKQVEFKNTDDLILFWMLYALAERTLQYYQQAAANSAYPAARQFFTALCQCKLLQKKRIDSIMRILYNHAWAEVGFAPFVLGKD